MNFALSDWASVLSSISHDAALAPFVKDGAAIVWSLDGQTILATNDIARNLVGNAGNSFGDTARERLRLLGQGLAPYSGVRLERLRLRLGFEPVSMTCACRRIRLATGAEGLLVIARTLLPIAMPMVDAQPLDTGLGEPETFTKPETFVNSVRLAKPSGEPAHAQFGAMPDQGLASRQDVSGNKGTSAATVPREVATMGTASRQAVTSDVVPSQAVRSEVVPTAAARPVNVMEALAAFPMPPMAPRGYRNRFTRQAPAGVTTDAPLAHQMAPVGELGVAAQPPMSEIRDPVVVQAGVPMADALNAGEAPAGEVPKAEAPLTEATLAEASPELAHRERLEGFLSGRSRLLWRSDSHDRITFMSPELPEILGVPVEETPTGRTWQEWLPGDAPETGAFLEKLASRSTWSGLKLHLGNGETGRRLAVALSGSPVFDAGKVFAGYRGFGMIVSQELHAEARNAEAQEASASTRAVENVPPFAEPVEGPRQPPVASTLPPSLAKDAEGEQPGHSVPMTGTKPLPAAMPDERGPGEETSRIDAKPELSPAERNAFRQIAQALGARQADGGETGVMHPASAGNAPLPLPLIAAPSANATDIGNDAAPGAIDGDSPVAMPPHGGPADLQDETIRSASGNGHARPGRPVFAPLKLVPVAGMPKVSDGKGHDGLVPSATGPVPSEAEVQPGKAAPDEAGPRLGGLSPRPDHHAELMDKLPIGVLVNRGDRAVYANRTFLDLLGYAGTGEIAAMGGLERLFRGPAPQEGGGSVLLMARDGGTEAVEARLSSISWQGKPATLLAFRRALNGDAEIRVEDALARASALELDATHRSERLKEMTAILDTATDGVITLDERGRVLSLNSAAEALFGYDQREVTGEIVTLLLAPESHVTALDYLEGLKGGGVASIMNDGREVQGVVRQGGRVPLFMTMGQISDGQATSGGERKFCAVLRDITAWKQAEAELTEARRAAEKASAQKSDVLAKISHEIRTPLNAIIGFSEVMAEERFGPLGSERYKEYARDIRESGGYLISLVNDLLDLAKIEAGRLDLDFISVNLNEIAASAVSLLQPEATRNRVVLRSGLSPKLPPVVADERSLRQIIINLLSNAVKFTDAGGQVIVSTALGDRGEAILRVRDTGIGMSEKDLKLALEPFRQVSTTRRGGGTGLGLPLTKALVEANRGSFVITSVEKEGTLAEVIFPPQRVLAS